MRPLLALSVFAGLALLAPVHTGATDTSAYDNLSLEAKSVYVQDLSTNVVLWSRSPEAQLPLASLTKLMTAYTYLKDGGTDVGRVCYTLVTSSNSDADALAQVSSDDPIRDMNANAKDLGMTQTFYLNPSGLDISPNLSGAYGSARDAGTLLRALRANFSNILDCTTKENASWGGHTGNNTNLALSKITGIIGTKTGFTDLAGGNLAVLVDAGINHPVAIVVLGSSQDGRFSDVMKLAETTINYLATNSASAP